MRSRAVSWLGSLALHGALVIVALRCRPERSEPVEGVPVTVSIAPAIAPAIAPVPVPVPDLVAKARAAGGGSKQARGAAPRAGGSAIAGVEQEGSRSGTGLGTGTGTGLDTGTGTGLGGAIGGETARTVPPPPPPPPIPKAKPRSLARPARLIWPTRHRDERPGQVFVMSLVVDDDGYVDGVRLVQGIGGRQDDQAQAAVWTFRYDPARDDAGRPIRSRVEQRFMLDD